MTTDDRVFLDFTPLGLSSLYTLIEEQLTRERHPLGAFRVLSEAAVERVPGAEYAGITRGATNGFTTAAATDELVLEVDRLQYELGSGPCVDAILRAPVFRTDDLRTDERWPDFGRKAFELTGIVSMLSFRLYLEPKELSTGLNLYSTQPAAFDHVSQTVGLLMATHGALAVAAAVSREKADNLEQALRTSRNIGIAIGVLMSQHKVTHDQAFNLLRIASQNTNRRIADLAVEVAETGLLELPTETG